MTRAARVLACALLVILVQSAPSAEPSVDAVRLGGGGFRNPSFLTALALSPDGALLACRDRDGAVRLWSLADRKVVRVLTAEAADRSRLAFTPDGKRLATVGTDGVTTVWDVKTGKTLWTFGSSSSPLRVAPIAWSPDGKHLAVGGDTSNVVLLDGQTGTQLHLLLDLASIPAGLVFSPDGKTLAGVGSRLVLWDIDPEGKRAPVVRKDLRLDRSAPRGLAFSPDGKLLAVAAARQSLQLFDPATGDPVLSHPLSGVRSGECLSFSPCGRFVCMQRSDRSGDGGVTVLAADTAKETQTLPVRASSASGESFLTFGRRTVDGKPHTLLAVPDGSLARVWDLDADAELHAPTGHTDVVQALSFSPDGKRIATAGADWSLRIWECATGKEVQKKIFVPRPSPGQLLFSADDSVRFVDGRIESRMPPGRGFSDRDPGGRSPRGMRTAVSPDGLLHALFERIRAPNGIRGTIDILDVKTSARLRSIPVESLLEEETIRPQFTPDGRLLFFIRGSEMALWDVATGQPWRRVTLPGLALGNAHFSPDCRLFIVPAAGRTAVVETLTGKERLQLDGTETVAAAFSPDGRLVAMQRGMNDSRRVDVIDMATGRVAARLSADLPPAGSLLRFSPDGKLLAVQEVGGVVLLHNLSELNPSAPRELSAEVLAALWDDLAGEDAIRAHRAVWELSGAKSGQVTALLRDRFASAETDLAKRVAELLRQLDADDFAARERASDALAGMGAAARPALKKALDGKPSPEVRRRVTELLDAISTSAGGAHPKIARLVRAVEVLERLGTAEGRKLLEEIAKGPADAEATQEARAALARLSR